MENKRARSESFGMTLAVWILLVLSTTWVFTRNVWANSPIPEPMVIVDVKNGPGEYYLTFLFRCVSEAGRENSPLHLDDVNWDRAQQYFSEFYYDGWQIGSSGYKDEKGEWNHPVFNCRGDGTYSFSHYNIRNTFRVLIITSDGSVRLSRELNREDKRTSEWVYDFAEDQYSLYMSASEKILQSPWFGIALCYIITVLIELAVFVFFNSYACVKKNYLLVILVNACTNIPMNFFLAFQSGFKESLLDTLLSSDALLLVLEVIVFAVEAVVYSFILKNSQKKTSVKNSILYSFFANACSLFVGMGIYGFVSLILFAVF